MDRYSGWRNTKTGREIFENDAPWGADGSAVVAWWLGVLFHETAFSPDFQTHSRKRQAMFHETNRSKNVSKTFRRLRPLSKTGVRRDVVHGPKEVVHRPRLACPTTNHQREMTNPASCPIFPPHALQLHKDREEVAGPLA